LFNKHAFNARESHFSSLSNWPHCHCRFVFTTIQVKQLVVD